MIIGKRVFNSRKINNDPEPYVVDFGIALGEVRSAEDCGSHWDSHDTRYEPRPEYDNNPNQILMVLRDNIRSDTRMGPEYHFQRMLLWVDMAQGMSESGIFSRAEEEHTRKVLEKLVSVYG